MRSDHSIADLHYTIQIAMGWSDSHLHRFHIHGKDYGVAHEGGLTFSDDPERVFAWASSVFALSPFPGDERFGIDQLERGADSKQSGPCHVEIARRGNQASMTEEALYQGEFHPTLNDPV